MMLIETDHPADNPRVCRAHKRFVPCRSEGTHIFTSDPEDVEMVRKHQQAGDDPVNHPSHYNWLNGIEVIDITEQLNFNLGNAVKYILRADHKGNPIQDLKKAEFYIRRELSRRTS